MRQGEFNAIIVMTDFEVSDDLHYAALRIDVEYEHGIQSFWISTDDIARFLGVVVKTNKLSTCIGKALRIDLANGIIVGVINLLKDGTGIRTASVPFTR